MQIQISWLLQKPTDLALHCFQRQGISGLSRTRVKVYQWHLLMSELMYTVFELNQSFVPLCHHKKFIWKNVTAWKPSFSVYQLGAITHVLVTINKKINKSSPGQGPDHYRQNLFKVKSCCVLHQNTKEGGKAKDTIKQIQASELMLCSVLTMRKAQKVSCLLVKTRGTTIFDPITAHTSISAQSSNFVFFRLQAMHLLLYKALYY